MSRTKGLSSLKIRGGQVLKSKKSQLLLGYLLWAELSQRLGMGEGG